MFATDLYIDTTLKNEKVLKYEYLKEHIKNSNYRTILEIGCGAGTVCRTLAKDFPDKEITGYDVDCRAINWANSKNWEALFFKKYNNLDYTNSLTGLTKGELVILLDVLEHVKHPDSFLHTLNIISNKKYKLFIHIPLEKSGIYSINYFRDIKSLYSEHEKFYKYEWLVDLLDHNGFRVIEQKFHYHFISGFRDFLKYYLLYKSNIEVNDKEAFYTKNWQNLYKSKFLLKILDFCAYYESKFLAPIEFGASGVTLIAEPK